MSFRFDSHPGRITATYIRPSFWNSGVYNEHIRRRGQFMFDRDGDGVVCE